MKTALLIIIFLASLLPNSTYAQQPKTDKYVVITFEHRFKRSQHGTQYFYWIIPQDSIKLGDIKPSQLFLTEYSADDLNDCCSGKPIDPTTTFTNTNNNFADGYRTGVDSLVKMIKRHRVSIQTMVKKWKGGQEETLTIYATPIIGKFCNSPFVEKRNYRRDYQGVLYIPYASFVHDAVFWETESATLLPKRDLSILNFRVFQY